VTVAAALIHLLDDTLLNSYTPTKKINNNQLKKLLPFFLFSLFPSFDHPCFFLNVVGWGLLDIGCFSLSFLLSFFDGGKFRN
jgi:hypothetical protein